MTTLPSPNAEPDLPARILVVEDDPGMRTLILRALQGDGFRVRGVQDGREMWLAFEISLAELIVLDVMLPGDNGFELCRALRQHPRPEISQIPIIMVSARGEELDRVHGLELGADDYLPKPFGQKELLARVRAVLRRSAGATDNGQRTRQETRGFSGWKLDLRRRELVDPSGAVVELSGAEHDLLVSFLDNPQRVIGRDRLLELSRSRLGDVTDRSVDVLVSRLRRKLGEQSDTLIRTVRGVGYIFIPPVEHL